MSGFQHDADDLAMLHHRLLWFRTDHSDAAVTTEIVSVDSEMAVCKATIRTSDGALATGHAGGRWNTDGDRYVEIAEDRALLRALTMAGYSGQEDGETQDLQASEPPAPLNLVSARSLLRDEESEPEEAPSPPQPVRQPSQEQDNETADAGANVNWNKFWNWARPRGYTSARELNEMLGVENVLAFTPGEVRQMIVRYELDNPPGGQDE